MSCPSYQNNLGKDTTLMSSKQHEPQFLTLTPPMRMQEEIFKRREEQLKLKDLELQESLIRFSKFLQENDSKRARAEKKAADEIKARLQKEAEIEQLSEQLEDLRTEKESVHEVLEKSMRWVRSVRARTVLAGACVTG